MYFLWRPVNYSLAVVDWTAVERLSVVYKQLILYTDRWKNTGGTQATNDGGSRLDSCVINK